MKALSLWQPWATLAVSGEKRIETRSWATKIRGALAIHATERFPADAFMACFGEPFISALVRVLRPDDTKPCRQLPERLPVGCIVGVVDLIDVQSMNEAGFVPPTEPERSFGIYGPGRFAWTLAYPRRLIVPIPCRGGQRLWNVASALEAQIHSQLDSQPVKAPPLQKTPGIAA